MNVRTQVIFFKSFTYKEIPHLVATFSLAASSLSLFRRCTVALAEMAGAVDNDQAPPAIVFLQPLHLQIPTAVLLMASYIVAKTKTE